MKKVLISLFVFTLCLLNANEKPVGLTPSEYFQLSKKEQKIYVSAVLDGEVFLLYSNSSPHYKAFNTCIKKEDIDKVLQYLEIDFGLGENLDDPMPWAISKAMGQVCKKYK